MPYRRSCAACALAAALLLSGCSAVTGSDVESLVLARAVRQGDCLGRWGGEEFLLICPETRGEQALQLDRKSVV